LCSLPTRRSSDLSSGVLDNLFGETSRGLRVGQLLSGFRARLDVRAAGPTNGRKNLVEDPRLELLNALTHNRVLDAPGLTLADSPVEATLGEGVNALVTAGGWELVPTLSRRQGCSSEGPSQRQPQDPSLRQQRQPRRCRP